MVVECLIQSASQLKYPQAGVDCISSTSLQVVSKTLAAYHSKNKYIYFYIIFIYSGSGFNQGPEPTTGLQQTSKGDK